MRRSGDEDPRQLAAFVGDRLQYLVTARPTAVNMSNAARDINALCARLLGSATAQQLRQE